MTKLTDGWGWWAGTSEEYMNLGGPFASREEAISEGRFQQAGEAFWIVQARPAEWSPPDAEDVMNRIAESGDDYEMFYEDGFPGFDCSDEVEKEAQADLQAALDGWFGRWQHIFPTPTSFSGTSGLERIDDANSDRDATLAETPPAAPAEGSQPGPSEETASPNLPAAAQDLPCPNPAQPHPAGAEQGKGEQSE